MYRYLISLPFSNFYSFITILLQIYNENAVLGTNLDYEMLSVKKIFLDEFLLYYFELICLSRSYIRREFRV